jgi:L-asparaginase
MPKILLVFTGGTIGSAAVGGSIDTCHDAPSVLLQQFQARYPDHEQVTFKTIRPLDLLSENFVPAAWTTLISAITAELDTAFDGIIITHGTDTLSYTAAALDVYFSSLKLPILLVSSAYPLTDSRANGLAHFICAVDFIRQIQQPGVFVPYQNLGQSIHIHQGQRLLSCLPLSNDYISACNKPYMHFANQQFYQLNPLINSAQPQLALKPEFSNRIVLITPYPGLDYRHINLANADAVLHGLYHSGTACASMQWGENHSLPAFIQHCREQAVEVYLAPIGKSPDAYQSTRLLQAAGAEMLWDITLETAYAILALAYGNFSENQAIKAFIHANL